MPNWVLANADGTPQNPTVAKGYGANTPADVTNGLQRAGMTPSQPFSPGAPIGPYDGYSRVPRSQDFITGTNIAGRPRRNERVSFNTLRGLIDAYDIAQICIWHRIDSVRSLDWNLVAREGIEGDVDQLVAQGRKALDYPAGGDPTAPFETWLGEFLYNVLAFDAGTLYRMRNNAGQTIGLQVVDGTLFAPQLDDWGNRPKPPAPAYVQYVQGLPWNWLTTDDIIYVPFRKVPNSPYGRAPLETILLAANTDLRLQAYFLQRFTDGNVPEAFAMAPETWTPAQIEEFQEYWDAFLYGDQAQKHQIKWVPGGTGFAWSNEKPFDDAFSLFLMRKTLAAYHVVPSDIGLTEDVNKASGDTQADVQFRVGDLPLIRYVERILTSFLQDDLGLPLDFKFDTGRETEDRLATAQAMQLYVDMAAISPSEVREEQFGLTEPDGIPVPRFINSKVGPIPLAALMGKAGPIDPSSGAPEPGAPLPTGPYSPVEGIIPLPGAAPVAKEATAGVTAATGVEGSPLTGAGGEDDEPAVDDEAVIKARDELAAFRRFSKTRRRAGTWRNFNFTTIDAVTAHNLNDDGRGAVRKAAGQIVAAGLAVVAADTGRVLMLQRALDPADPAQGMWEFPGGCLDDDEDPQQAAAREWAEEVGCLLPVGGTWTGGWTSASGVYVGFVYVIDAETQVALAGRGVVMNPDDPDGDVFEAAAWWAPTALDGNPVVRAELAGDLELVLEALASPVVKAANPGPKAWAADGAKVPQHQFDLKIIAHYTPLITAAISALFTDTDLAAAVAAAAGSMPVRKAAGDVAIARAAARDAVRQAVGDITSSTDLENVIRSMFADGYLSGVHGASVQTGANLSTQAGDIASGVDWSTWEPGDVQAAIQAADGGLANLLDGAGVTINGITDSTLDTLGNRIADGLLNGDSTDTVAAGLRGMLEGDDTRAQMIARTETARAQTAGTLDNYSSAGVTQFDWVLSDEPCAECSDAADGNPHELGDDAPPLHPNCRCAASPVLPSAGASSVSSGPEDAVDDSAE